MAPTTEAVDHDSTAGWLGADSAVKEHQRPPIYNPEDYAQALRKFGRRSPAAPNGVPNGNGGASGASPAPPSGHGRLPDNKSTLQSVGSSKSASCAALPSLPLAGLSSAAALGSAMSVTSSHRGSARGSTENLRPATANPQQQQQQQQQQQMQQMEPEMSLRQFDSVAELLNKLKADLRLAFPSFVQEFVDSAVDGVSLLLELLRTVQLQQQGGQGGGGVAVQRQALLQENACLQCLHGCLRCHDAPRRLAVSSAGLFTLAVSTMSSVNKSRVLALQLLTKVCEGAAEGHGAVSEALSTMRLRFGEPVRFRFLAGVLSSAGGQSDLLLSGLRFLNAFLRSAPGPQQRVYIQAELGQAGFQPGVLRQALPAVTAASAEVQAEFDAWERQQVDVAELTQRVQQAESRATQLQDQLSQLQRRLQVLSLEHALKGGKDAKGKDDDDSRSTPAEDEGISSSDQDRSLSPDGVEREPLVYEVVLKVPDERKQPQQQHRAAPRTAPRAGPRKEQQGRHDLHDDDEEETTIEEVMEEFQNIINDAETEVYANNHINGSRTASDLDVSKNVYVNSDTLTARIQVPYPQENSTTNSSSITTNNINNNSNNRSSNNYTSSSSNNYNSSSSQPPVKSGRLRLEALFQNGPPAKPTPPAPQPSQRLALPPRHASLPHHQQHDDGGLGDALQAQADGESEIVPSALLPQPPRRAKSLVHLCAPSTDYVNLCNSSPFFDDADSFSNGSGDGDNSDSLLSASREQLGYSLDADAVHAESTRDKNLRNARNAASLGLGARDRDALEASRAERARPSRGYRSIAMIMPDEDCRDCDRDEDDIIKPVEVSVYQGIPDILRCSKQQAPSHSARAGGAAARNARTASPVDPATVRNGSNYQPAGAATGLPKASATPSTATTASAASAAGVVKPARKQLDGSASSARTGNFDGLFYVADSPKSGRTSLGVGKPVNGKPPAPAVAPKKGKAARADRPDSQRAKSKSLERVDDGVNSMMDIVVKQQQQQQQRLAPEGVFQTREWSVEWGVPGVGRLPGLPAAGRLPPPTLQHGQHGQQGPVVIVSRSTSVRHQQRQQFQPAGRPTRRTPPEGATAGVNGAHPLFLPVSSRVSAFEKGDARHLSPPMGPAMGPSASFVIKRGHTNAGLYSGHHAPGHGPSHGPGHNASMAKIVNTAPVPGLGLPGMPGMQPDFTRGIHVNLALPSGKLTDLPSGLY